MTKKEKKFNIFIDLNGETIETQMTANSIGDVIHEIAENIKIEYDKEDNNDEEYNDEFIGFVVNK